MKKYTFMLLIFLFFTSIAVVFGFSTYGSPSEFGNESDTTCFIGGDFGILNCTGNITGNYFFGNGSQLKGITTIIAQDLNCDNCLGTPQIADVYLQLIGGTMIGNIKSVFNITANYFSGNGSNLTNVNASSVNCDDIYFSGTQGSPSICDGDDAFGAGDGGQGMWKDIGLWLEPNETFAINVNITGDLKIQDGGDFSCIACINPADINDIDKENIESDLNTFVDIGGDTMTGDLFSDSNINTSGIINASIFQIAGTNILSLFTSITNAWKLINFTNAFHAQYALTGYKKANLTLDYPNLDTDSTNDVTSVSGAAPMSSTGGTTPTLSMTQSDSGTAGYLSSTDWSTFNSKLDDSGDTITGNFVLDDGTGESPRITFINQNDQSSQIYEQTDGDLYLSAADGLEFAGNSFRMTTLTNCDTIDTSSTGVLSCGSDDDTTYGASGTLLDLTGTTFSVNAGTLTDERLCEYEATGTQLECNLLKDSSGDCAAGSVCLGGHAHSQYGDMNDLVDDTTPQLGGYLDTNAQNIGSTADEIENIYIGLNQKIFLGNAQEGEIYYDGTKLVIKVN